MTTPTIDSVALSREERYYPTGRYNVDRMARNLRTQGHWIRPPALIYPGGGRARLAMMLIAMMGVVHD